MASLHWPRMPLSSTGEDTAALSMTMDSVRPVLMFITTDDHFFVDIIKLMMICSVINAPFPIIDSIGIVK